MTAKTDTPAAFLRRVQRRRYTLKPVAWKKLFTRDAESYTGTTEIAALAVFRSRVTGKWTGWSWEVYFSEHEVLMGPCASANAGKAEAEKLVAQKILKHLRPEKTGKNAGIRKKSRNV